jgi:23S rRNA (guanosine2251-2'-O)-methyltransferase
VSGPEHWIWGRQPVLEAILAKTAHSVLIARNVGAGQSIHSIEKEATRAGIPIQRVDSSAIERIAPGAVSQGVAASVRLALFTEVADVLDQIPNDTVALLVALDRVQDPHNLGAVLRSADAAGAHGVVFPARHAATVSGGVAKASAGAMHHVKMAQVTNLARSLEEIRRRNIWVVGLDGHADRSLFNVDLSVPLCVVVGGEESGLRRLTRDHCDILARIPMRGSVSSLNASVAAGVALFEAVRQRGE